MIRLDINEVVEEAVTLLRHEALRHGVAIKLELESGRVSNPAASASQPVRSPPANVRRPLKTARYRPL
jgi:hypothetical protein